MEHLDAGRRIVAPSEVVAADWRRRVLLHSHRRAILESQIVPWDRFKEEVFGLKTDRRPVNRAFRQLFVLDLLRRHTAEPIFRRIVHPELTDGAGGMAAPLSRLLPALPQLPQATPEAATDRQGDPTIRDLYRLRQEYEGFLDRYRLFEPNWLAPSGPDLASPTSLFFPELVEDFQRFAPVLRGHPEPAVVSLVDLDGPGSRRFVQHATAIGEFRAVAEELSDHLDAGVYPADLAVTLAGWDAAYPYFRRECELLDVALAPRRGRALTEFPGARLFELLRQAVDSDFEITKVEALLCDPSLPWKFDLHVRRIVSLGRAGRSLGRFGPEGSDFDFWSDALRRQNAPPEMRSAIRRLFRILHELRRAPDLASLRQLVFRLLNGYVDREAWSPETRPALERSLELLGALSEAQTHTGIELPDAFGAWRNALAATTYVAQAEGVAVPVYDYRVASGIVPEHHFVVNAHHGATRVLVDPLPSLRSDQKTRLGLEPFSMSDQFLLGYSLSGSQVTISGAEEGVNDRQMTPDWFYPDQVLRAGATEAPGRFLGAEEALMSGAPGPPGEIWPVQWEGLSRYAETEGGPRPGGALSAESIGSVIGDRLYSQEGALLLSASRLSSYLSCPQAYLLSYALGLEDEDPQAVPETATPLEEGILSHELLRSLHQELQESGEAFDRLGRLSAEELFRRMAETIRSWGVRNLATPGVLAQAAAHKLVPQLLRALEWEAERFAHRTPGLVEAKLTGTPVPGVLLTGKIDLVVRPREATEDTQEESEELEIVDFKRSSTPAAGSLEWAKLAPDQIVELIDGGWEKMDVQLPVYVSLLESHGRRVGRGSFYSMKKGEDSKSAFSAGGDPSREEVLGALEVLITEVSRRIGGGILGIPNRGLGCAACRFRGVCRAKFVSEERHDPPRL